MAALTKYYRLAEAEKTSSDAISATFATTDVCKRDGHRLMPGCFKSRGHDGLANYVRAGAPLVLAHNVSDMAFGSIANLRVAPDGALKGEVKFANHERARDLADLYRSGAMRAFSLSWLPVEHKYATGANRAPGAIDFHKVDILEISAVVVPADPRAVAEARSFGVEAQFRRVATAVPKMAPARDRTDRAVNALMRLAHEEARVLRDVAKSYGRHSVDDFALAGASRRLAAKGKALDLAPEAIAEVLARLHKLVGR